MKVCQAEAPAPQFAFILQSPISASTFSAAARHAKNQHVFVLNAINHDVPATGKAPKAGAEISKSWSRRTNSCVHWDAAFGKRLAPVVRYGAGLRARLIKVLRGIGVAWHITNKAANEDQ